MNVLVACEESQRVCSAFRAKGHNAFSCDIQDPSGGHPEWHIRDNVLNVLNPEWLPDVVFKPPYKGICFVTMDDDFHCIDKWDLIIAHPPCTYFSTASAITLYIKPGVLNTERYNKGLKYRELFFAILNADCEKICVENPTPLKIWELPKPNCIIQPYEFGEPYSKRTCLWLKNLPPLIPTELVGEFVPFVNCHKGYEGAHGVVRGSKLRSKTFPGIAAAMAEQWG